MVARSRARYLAPIALVATIAGTYVVVHAGLTSKHGGAHVHSRRHGARRGTATARFYVVRPGDSLTGVAVKTRVPLATLLQLNPGLDPNSLQTGHRLRLRQ